MNGIARKDDFIEPRRLLVAINHNVLHTYWYRTPLPKEKLASLWILPNRRYLSDLICGSARRSDFRAEAAGQHCDQGEALGNYRVSSIYHEEALKY